jgi:hypothetical protein
MSNSQLLELQLSGDLNSTTLLVFLQGWPDSADMWEYYMGVSNELKDYKILKINLPNYGKERIPWGQDFPIILDRLKATIDSVTGVEKRVLVCHDWGCFHGYHLDEVNWLVELRDTQSTSARSSPWIFHPNLNLSLSPNCLFCCTKSSWPLRF